MTTAAYYGVPARSVIAAIAIARAASREGARMTAPVIPFPTPAQRLLRQSRRRPVTPVQPHHQPEPPRAA